MPIVSDIYYQPHLGDGLETPPVVLLHGAGGTHLSWPAEVRRLAGMRVYALDLPGHGNSTGRGQQSISGYARCVIEWLEAVRLPRAIFVGHSMGGAIALELALDYPDRVLALGLCATGPRLPIPPDILMDVASATTYRKASDSLSRLAFSPAASASLIGAVLLRMAGTRQSVLHGDLLACSEFDITQQLTRIPHPALVVCGADDLLTPVRLSQFMADGLPQGRLMLIPQAGHMLILEQPQILAQGLRKFIAEIPYSAG